MRKRFTLRQILILSFSLVCVLPVATLAIWLHYGIQQHALDEAREKNQILSQNLAIPIQTYLQDARLSLANLGGFLEQPENPKATSNAAKQQHYFRSILLLNEHGITRRLTTSTHTQTTLGDARLSALALPYLGSRSRTQTQVIRDPYSGEPTVLFVQPLGKDLLVGLLDLQPVVSLGQQVKFGERGHAAITDQFGNVVLHPNPHWIKEIKNIAELPIIQANQAAAQSVYSPCRTDRNGPSPKRSEFCATETVRVPDTASAACCTDVYIQLAAETMVSRLIAAPCSTRTT